MQPARINIMISHADWLAEWGTLSMEERLVHACTFWFSLSLSLSQTGQREKSHMLTDWLNEEHLEHTRTSVTLFARACDSLSLRLARERERTKEREKESEKEGERERERGRDVEYGCFIFII